jgi:hypothetical protein
VRNKTLWLVAAVCFGPALIAYLLYFGVGPRMAPLAGSRELVEPPVTLEQAAIAVPEHEIAAGAPPVRWSLLYVRTTPCDDACLIAVDRLHRVHLALGDEADRVQRVYLHTGEPPRIPDDPTLLIRELPDGGSAVVSALGAERVAGGRVYIADPLGNVVAGYPADVEMRELLRDVERLLDVSRIG